MRVTGVKKLIVMARIIIETVMGASLVCMGLLFHSQNRVYMDKRIRIWNKNMLNIVQAKCKVFNQNDFEFKKNRAYIIMSNHLSLYDIPLIFSAFPSASIRMIAKKELFKIPVFGWGIGAGECIPIDRKNPRQAITKDLVVAKQKMQSGIVIWIAPEGGRSRNGEMGAFKRGGFKLALDTQAIIVPVTIVGSNKILPPDTFDFSVGEQIEIHIGKPIDTQGCTVKNIPELMEEVAAQIRSKL